MRKPDRVARRRRASIRSALAVALGGLALVSSAGGTSQRTQNHARLASDNPPPLALYQRSAGVLNAVRSGDERDGLHVSDDGSRGASTRHLITTRRAMAAGTIALSLERPTASDARRAVRLELQLGASKLRFRTRVRVNNRQHLAVRWGSRSVSLVIDGQVREEYRLRPRARPVALRFATPRSISVGSVVLFGERLSARRLRVGVERASLMPRHSARANRRGSVRALAAVEGGPENVTPPELWSSPFVGEYVETDGGTWDETLTDLLFQWERCDAEGQNCAPIDGATDAWYVPTDDDLGSRIRGRVTAVNEDGTSELTTAVTDAIGAARAPIIGETPVIDGVVEVGGWLYPSFWFDGAEPIEYRFQWYACDGPVCEPIDGATGWDLPLTQEQFGKEIYVEVTAENVIGTTISTSPRRGPVEGNPLLRPQNYIQPQISGTMTSGAELMASTGSWDNVDESTQYTYQWYRCITSSSCVAIDGATNSTYRLVGADVDRRIRVRVFARNEFGTNFADSWLTGMVIGYKPVNVAPPEVQGDPQDGETLSVTDGQWTSGTPITYSYEWSRCTWFCIPIDGATAATYELTSADVGHVISATVKATNEDGTTTAWADTGTEVQPLPLAGMIPPTVSGTAQLRESLTSTVGTWTGSAPRSYGRQWQRCDAQGGSCVAIPGATRWEYTTQQQDVGSKLRLLVVATNAAGSVEAVSEPTAVVTGLIPELESPPSIAGHPVEGAVLTADDGEWIGAEPITTSMRWQRCDSAGASCTDIAGAGGGTYRLGADDTGNTVRVVVTGTNTAGSTEAQSDATGEVLSGAPRPVGRPVVTGAPHPGQSLVATTGVWAGTQPIQLARQWQRCAAGGSDCEDIAGATGDSYAVGAGDAGRTLRVRVSATNAAGEQEAFSLATIVTAATAPHNLETPAVVGSPLVGTVLEATPGEWSGASGLTSYRWQRCDAAGTCRAVAGADATTYRLSTADVGHTVQVVETTSSEGGDASAVSAPTDPVRSRVPVLALGFDEGRGSVAHDVMTDAPIGVPAAATWVSGGRYGGALSFDGQYSHMTAAVPALAAPGQRTIAAWVKQGDALTSNATLVRQRADDGTIAFSLDAGLDGTLRARVGTTTLVGPRLTIGRWTHVALADDGSVARLFVDGAVVASAEAAVEASREPVTIGGDGSLASGFGGLIDEPRIYNRSLTEEEIERVRQRALAPDVANRPLLAYAFDDDDDGVALDSSGFGHNGAVTGGQWIEEGYLSGSALELDGDSAFVSAGLEPLLDMDGGVTLEVAVRPQSAANEQPLISKEPALGSATILWARDVAGNLAIQTADYTLVGPSLPLDVWSHVAFVDDGEDARLYVDGEQVASTPTETPPALRGTTTIGATAGGRFLDAAVDDVRMYDRALTPAELLVDQSAAVEPDDLWVAPQLDLHGTLLDNEEETLSGSDAYDLRVDATEAINDGGWVPGVTRLQVLIDDEMHADVSQGCPDGGCSLSRTFSFVPADLPEGTHEIDIVATDAFGHKTRDSVTMEVAAQPVQDGVGGLLAEVGDDNIALTWRRPASPHLIGYKIRRTRRSGCCNYQSTWLVDEPQQDTSFVDDQVLPGYAYSYNVVAVYDHSEYWVSTGHLILSTRPLAPAGLAAAGEPNAIELTWQASQGAPDGYMVYRSATAGGPYEPLTDDPVDSTSYRDERPPGETYYYVVHSIHGAQLSERSIEVSAAATPPPPEGPAIVLSGELVDHAGEWLDADPVDVQAVAQDQRSSGLATVEMLLDGEQIDVTAQGCAEASCALTVGSTINPIDLEDGIHELEVIATDGAGGTTSETLDVRVNHQPPAQVEGLVGAAGNHRVVLRWSESSELDIAGYEVLRATAPEGPFTAIGGSLAEEPPFVDSSADNGATYSYAVRAVDRAGERGPQSDTVTVTAGGAAAAPPTDVRATAEPYAIALSWSGTQAGDLDGYNVYRIDTSGRPSRPVNRSPISATSFTDGDVEPGEPQTYVVRAVNTSGELSDASESVTAAALELLPLGPRDFVYRDREDPRLEWHRLCCTDLLTWYEVLVETGDTGIAWSDADTGATREICAGMCAESYTDWNSPITSPPSLSPDGDAVVWTYGPNDGHGVIMISGADGSGQRMVCGTPEDDGPACVDVLPLTGGGAVDAKFSHDGRRILYGGDGIYSIALNGADRRQLVAPFPDAILRDPVESADGSSLYFTVEDSWTSSVWKADADGSNPRQVDLGVSNANAPRPSPDGRKLLFRSGTSTDAPIYVSDADGTNAEPFHDAVGSSPGWSPDGRSVILSRPVPAPGVDNATNVVAVDAANGGEEILLQPQLQNGTVKSYPISPSYRQAHRPSIDSPDLVGNDRFTDGTGDITVRLRAVDAAGGIARAGVAVSGEHASVDLECGDTCPRTVTPEITLDGTQLSEGRHNVRLVAANTGGTRSVARRSLIVDRTAPAEPTHVSSAPDASEEHVTVTWQPGIDPPLADGSRGSGVQAVEHRHRTSDGSWSAWTRTDASSLLLAADALSAEEPEVQLRSLDGAGRTSTTATAMVARAAPCTAKLELEPTSRHYVKRNGDAIDAPNAAAETEARLDCKKDSGVEISGWILTLGPDKRYIDGIIDPPAMMTAEGVGRTTSELEMDCIPGYRTYVATVAFAAAGWTIGGFSAIKGSTMNCNEMGMWRHRTWETGGTRPERVLAQRLGSRPHPRWAAHHIIPAFDDRWLAPRAQARGYSCRIRPNEAHNGVWMSPYEHQRVHNPRYFRWIFNRLGRAMFPDPDGRWNGACDYDKARSIMAAIKRRIASGKHYPGKP